MNFIQEARLKAGVWLRERKERAEERKAHAAAMSSEHGHGRFFLLHVPAMATICAAVVEWYWALLFCIEATGSLDWNYRTTSGTEIPAASVWNFAFETHWPIFLGLVCATIPIVMLSMVWLPVQFAMRGSGMWRRGTVIAVGVLANLLVIVSGTVVMNGNRQEQVRAAVVVEQTAEQGRAAIDARLSFAREELRIATTNTNPYLNQAANVGAAEWERSYVAQARATNDPRLPQLERAMGAARRADALRADIERLTVERATAAPEAASAANVEDTVGRELNTFAQIVEVWRPPFVAVICCLIGIFGAWWVLALMQGLNPRDVLRSGWADEAHRLEDKRHEAPVEKQPYIRDTATFTRDEKGNDEIMLDEDGAPLKEVRYWKREDGKPLVKNRAQSVSVTPEIPESERGVTQDGGNRIAMTVGGPVDMDAPSAIPEQNVKENAEPEPSQEAHNEIGDVQSETSVIELPDDFSAELEPVEEQVQDEAQAADEQHGVEQDDADGREPETNPARMIAAE